MQPLLSNFKKKFRGGWVHFWGGWGCQTPKENSLQPPQNQKVYSLKSRIQSVKGWRGRQTDGQTSFYFVFYVDKL